VLGVWKRREEQEGGGEEEVVIKKFRFVYYHRTHDEASRLPPALYTACCNTW